MSVFNTGRIPLNMYFIKHSGCFFFILGRGWWWWRIQKPHWEAEHVKQEDSIRKKASASPPWDRTASFLHEIPSLKCLLYRTPAPAPPLEISQLWYRGTLKGGRTSGIFPSFMVIFNSPFPNGINKHLNFKNLAWHFYILSIVAMFLSLSLHRWFLTVHMVL